MSLTYQDRIKEKRDLSKKIIDIAKEFVPFVFVMINSGKDALTRFGENEITQNVSQEITGAEILLVKDKKVSKVSLDDLSKENIKMVIEKAATLLEFQEDQEHIPDFPIDEIIENENLNWDKETASVSPEKRSEVVKGFVKKCKENKLLASGTVSDVVNSITLASSKGLFAYHEYTRGEFTATAMDDDGYSGWGSISEKSYDINKINELQENIVKKAILSKDPVEIEPKEYTVILEPAAVSDLFLFLSYVGLSTQGYYLGTSPFSNRLGEKILSEKLTITDDFSHEQNPGFPFDFEGVRKKSLEIVNKGILNRLPFDLKWAEKKGKSSTGHGFPFPNTMGPLCGNLVIAPGESSMEEIISSSKDALLITHFHYTNIINPNDITITGMTRDGVYKIKDGKITNSVKNMRFTESVIKALNNIEAISSDQVFQSAFFGGGFVLPALKINNFRFSSKTDY
ncbi:MAG: hypothetical protein C0601_06685 [Candidatus Muiribacterium halophilum]|uniref:TldD/PmbA family protein n=1 Tax=Muiribacterium halophilum TaxID=2053465 RepID=A0A2N5ZGG8_MUIH1|nr:MAG: hypothetical protein C0601_06685 [Candidatus Muirbacterium halophilum]